MNETTEACQKMLKAMIITEQALLANTLLIQQLLTALLLIMLASIEVGKLQI